MEAGNEKGGDRMDHREGSWWWCLESAGEEASGRDINNRKGAFISFSGEWRDGEGSNEIKIRWWEVIQGKSNENIDSLLLLYTNLSQQMEVPL